MKTKLTWFGIGAASASLIAFAGVLTYTWFQEPVVNDTLTVCKQIARP